MGIYINMEMPKSCRDCRFCNGQVNTDYGVCAWCDVDGKDRDEDIMQDCPLVPVPPHGRLVVADALVDSFDPSDFWNPDAEDNCFAAIHVVNCAPTVIPAEEGET